MGAPWDGSDWCALILLHTFAAASPRCLAPVPRPGAHGAWHRREAPVPSRPSVPGTVVRSHIGARDRRSCSGPLPRQPLRLELGHDRRRDLFGRALALAVLRPLPLLEVLVALDEPLAHRDAVDLCPEPVG